MVQPFYLTYRRARVELEAMANEGVLHILKSSRAEA